jgi:hypothetical protein
MVAASAGWSLRALWRGRLGRGLLPVAAYAAGAGVVGARLSRDPGVAPHRAAAALAICQWTYGLGFWAGVYRILRGRPFEARPRSR